MSEQGVNRKRTYRLKARADHQQATRLRIIETTAALHGEVGPARTTVADIARRAGVQRLTVYNNFPDDRSLFEACGAHWMSEHPFPPAMSSAMAEADPQGALTGVLDALYGWYRQHRPMVENMQRDRLLLPAMDLVMKVRMDGQMSDLAAGFASRFAGGGRSDIVRAAVALALDFWTWRRLSQEGITDSEASRMMAETVRSVGDLSR